MTFPHMTFQIFGVQVVRVCKGKSEAFPPVAVHMILWEQGFERFGGSLSS